MSTDPMAAQAGGGEPSEEELRAAYEAELARVTSTDMLGQAAVSLLNIGARRLGALSEGESAARASTPAAGSGRDLEQVRDAIDGARALLEILERRISPQELGPLKDALSRLQMAYAREVQLEPAQPAQPTAPGAGESPPPAGQQPGAPTQNQPQKPAEGPAGPGPGPAESSGRLWVPGR